MNGVPVFSPENAILRSPELICLGVLDAERAGQMEAQLRELGYQGEVIRPLERELFDTRIATMRLLAEEIRKEKTEGNVAELGVFRTAFMKKKRNSFYQSGC